MISVEDSVNFWIKNNQCSSFAEKEYLVDKKVIKQEFSGGIDNTRVIQYTIVNGSHSWPGGKKGLQSEGDPISSAEFSASKIIVDFIKSHNK